jgi:hypothetical protein
MLSGCGQSYIKFNSTNNLKQDPNDANAPVGQVEATGSAADTLAKQLADNIKTEAARLSDLFQYNSLLFMVLFLVMLGGVVFAVLTKSSWGWIIPTVAGGGLAALVFIVQAAEYIKWIGLGVFAVALGVLIYKAVQYQRERNAATVAAAKIVVEKKEVVT